MDREEPVGNVEGQCGLIGVNGPEPGHFIEGKKTTVQNSVSQ